MRPLVANLELERRPAHSDVFVDLWQTDWVAGCLCVTSIFGNRLLQLVPAQVKQRYKQSNSPGNEAIVSAFLCSKAVRLQLSTSRAHLQVHTFPCCFRLVIRCVCKAGTKASVASSFYIRNSDVNTY